MYAIKTSPLLTLALLATSNWACSQSNCKRFETHGKYGLKDLSDRILLSAEYDHIHFEKDGTFKINNVGSYDQVGEWIGGKWGLLHSKSEIIIPLKCDHLGHFSDGVATAL
jgi:hypothetical protein